MSAILQNLQFIIIHAFCVLIWVIVTMHFTSTVLHYLISTCNTNWCRWNQRYQIRFPCDPHNNLAFLLPYISLQISYCGGCDLIDTTVRVCVGGGRYNSTTQSHKAVTAHFSSKQLLPSGFAEQYRYYAYYTTGNHSLLVPFTKITILTQDYTLSN